MTHEDAAPSAPRRQVLFILGVHRSGTSAFTRVLNLCGAHLATALMPPKAGNNDTGFWEPADIVALHEEMLLSAGSSWDDLSSIPDSWFRSGEAEGFKAKAVEILRRDYGDAPLSVIKDPRACRFVPFWREALAEIDAELLAVTPIRNPLEVAGSLGKRDGFSKSKSLLLWLRNLLDGERDTRGLRRSFVRYDELLRDWRGTVDRIGADLGVVWPRYSHQTDIEVERFLSADLRHNKARAEDLEAEPAAIAGVRRAYAAALALVDREPVPPSLFDEIRVELNAADRAYGPVIAADRLDLAAQHRHIVELNEKVIALSDTIAAVNAELTERSTRVHDLNVELTDREERLRQLIEDADRLNASLGERDGTIHALNLELAEREERLKRLNDAVADLNSDLAARDATVHQLNLDLAERDERLQELGSDVTRLNTDLAGRDTAIHEAHLQLQAHAAEIAALHGHAERLAANYDSLLADYRALHSSFSYRITAPLRSIRRLQISLSQRLRSTAQGVSLVPIHQLVDAADGGFVSLGEDPQFQVRAGRLPAGWAAVSYRVRYADPFLKPVLYAQVNDGRTLPIPLGFIRSGTTRHIVRLPDNLRGLRFDPMEQTGAFAIEDFSIHSISRLRILLSAVIQKPKRILRGLAYLRKHGVAATKAWVAQQLTPVIERREDYATWVELYDTLSPRDEAAIREDIGSFKSRPLISIVMPVYNIAEEYLRAAIESVRTQLYPHWELCIADDASTQPHVAAVLQEYAAADPRIKVFYREENGHISAASNSALALAEGEFVALLDNDDVLPPHALYMVAREIDEHSDVDMIFSDEDKIDEKGTRFAPYFKSDWNPDLMLSQNAFSHLGVFRRALIDHVGGFRLGLEGSQDYDLTLRAAAATTIDRIRHIPHVLYHWRAISGSVSLDQGEKSYPRDRARIAIADHLAAAGIEATVEASASGSFHRVRYARPDPLPSVSLIIPTRDKVELLRVAVDGMLTKTDYPDLEVIIVDNDSREPETLRYFEEVSADERVKVLKYSFPYNYSAINNFAAAHARGEVLGLINNDIEVIHADWLQEMVSHAMRPEVGAVGAMLYFPDDRIQHAGIIIGMNGVAGHGHAGLPRGTPGYLGRAELTQNYNAVTAAVLIMRHVIFDQIGGFDEKNLPIAFNDIDLCLRVRELGYSVVWIPHAELYHHESASLGKPTTVERQRQFESECAYMQSRWHTDVAADPYYNPNLALDRDFVMAFPPRAVKPWRVPRQDRSPG